MEAQPENIGKITVFAIKTICIVIGLFIFSVALFYCAARITAIDVKVLSQTQSSDKKWNVTIEDEEYKSIFSTPLYAVVLRPQTGWFKGLRGKKVFEISQESAATPPVVTWHSPDNLVVEAYGLERDITIQAPEYKNIKISYKIE